MKLKSLFFSLFFSLLVFSAGSAEALKIKFAVLAPEGSSWMVIMNKMDAEIRKRTNNKVKFQIFAGGKQGDESVVLQKIKIGSIHAAGFTGIGMGKILPEVRLLEVPMLARNYEEVDYLVENLQSHYEKKFEEKGFILVGWAETGLVRFFSAEKVQTIDEFKKVKMWAWKDDPLAGEFLKEIGLKPVFIPITDVLIQLETGMINSYYAPPLGAIALQWYPKSRYIGNTPITDSLGSILISKKKWNKMTPEQQKIVKEVMSKGCRELVQQVRKDNKKALEILEQSGIQTVEYPQETLDVFEAASMKLRQEMAGKMYSKELLERAEKLLEEFRAKKK